MIKVDRETFFKLPEGVLFFIPTVNFANGLPGEEMLDFSAMPLYVKGKTILRGDIPADRDSDNPFSITIRHYQCYARRIERPEHEWSTVIDVSDFMSHRSGDEHVHAVQHIYLLDREEIKNAHANAMAAINHPFFETLTTFPAEDPFALTEEDKLTCRRLLDGLPP
jgi:hypothetical protein